MPPQFVRKAKPIEAMQIKMRTFDEIVAWIQSEPKHEETVIKIDEDQMQIHFRTPHGVVSAGYGWWIAKNYHGILYPIKKDKFRHTYMEVVNAEG